MSTAWLSLTALAQPASTAACHTPSKGTMSLQIEPQICIYITTVVFFCISKAIKRATSCILPEEVSCGCFSPYSFLFVGSSHEKTPACVMDLNRAVNHCQQLVSCKTTAFLDAPCNSGLHVFPSCCLCIYL